MNNFKVGDRVERIIENAYRVDVGDINTVREYDGPHLYLVGFTGPYLPSRFKAYHPKFINSYMVNTRERQEALFDMGYRFDDFGELVSKVESLNMKYLTTNEDGRLGCGSCADDINEMGYKFDAIEFSTPVATVKVDPKQTEIEVLEAEMRESSERHKDEMNAFADRVKELKGG